MIRILCKFHFVSRGCRKILPDGVWKAPFVIAVPNLTMLKSSPAQTDAAPFAAANPSLLSGTPQHAPGKSPFNPFSHPRKVLRCEGRKPHLPFFSIPVGYFIKLRPAFFVSPSIPAPLPGVNREHTPQLWGCIIRAFQLAFIPEPGGKSISFSMSELKEIRKKAPRDKDGCVEKWPVKIRSRGKVMAGKVLKWFG